MNTNKIEGRCVECKDIFFLEAKVNSNSNIPDYYISNSNCNNVFFCSGMGEIINNKYYCWCCLVDFGKKYRKSRDKINLRRRNNPKIKNHTKNKNEKKNIEIVIHQ